MSMKFVLAVTGLVWASLCLHVMSSTVNRPGMKVVALIMITFAAELVIGIAYLSKTLISW